MGDHPRLPLPQTITTPRLSNGFNPDAAPVDRPAHATTLAGILAGIEQGVAERNARLEDLEDLDTHEESSVVLVIEGRTELDGAPFRRWGMTVLSEGDENTYLVLSDSQARRYMADLVGTYGKPQLPWSVAKSWRTQLDSITGMRLYGPQDRKDPGIDDLAFDGCETVDVLLWASSLEHPRLRSQVATARIEEVRALVESAAGRDDDIRVITFDDRPDSTLLRVTVDRHLLDALLDHPTVEQIRIPLRPTLTEDHLVDVEFPKDDPEPDGAPIGVVDDLINVAHPLLAGVVLTQRSFPPAGVTLNSPTQHGTQVAGVAAYGDLRPWVTKTGPLPQPHPIVGARIMHSDPADRDSAEVAGPLHEQLERALTWLAQQGVRVAVCSVNFPYPDDRMLPSESAAVIDRLSRELDMVVVVSAGNVDDVAPTYHWMSDYPAYLDERSAKVADPGAAALALTVSAVARHDVPAGPVGGPALAIAQSDQPSPFTRVGPTRGRGRHGTRKPEFEAHGGNYTHDPGPNLTAGGDPNLSVVSLSYSPVAGSMFTAVDGTSFAAPFVAHQVARIASRYPDASANLLRALTALSGRHRPAIASMPITAVVSAYGQPDAETVLESVTDKVIVVFEGAIPIGSTAVHRIPVPEEFATGHRGQQLRVALAFDPPVRRTRRVYATGDMAFTVVRAMDEDDVIALYSRQPTRAQAVADPDLEILDLPSDRRRPEMHPRTRHLASNTLISRTMSGNWDPDDQDYFLVVRHQVRPWARRSDLPLVQSYAFAIELSLQGTTDIDLLALVQNQLRAQTRTRLRG